MTDLELSYPCIKVEIILHFSFTVMVHLVSATAGPSSGHLVNAKTCLMFYKAKVKYKVKSNIKTDKKQMLKQRAILGIKKKLPFFYAYYICSTPTPMVPD